MTQNPTVTSLQKQLSDLIARVQALETRATRLEHETFKAGIPPNYDKDAKRQDEGSNSAS